MEVILRKAKNNLKQKSFVSITNIFGNVY